jgi:DNA invertase Pin-like site-specific DNA recombinase
MVGVFAEFETNLRRERQLEGIAKAKRKRVLQEPAGLAKCRQGTRNVSTEPPHHGYRIGLASVNRVWETGQAM